MIKNKSLCFFLLGIVCLLLSLIVVSGLIIWDTKYPYDSLTDGVLNQSLWTNSSTNTGGNGAGSWEEISTPNGYAIRTTSYSGTTADEVTTNTLTTNAMPDYAYVKNVTVTTNLSGNDATWRYTEFYAFGVSIKKEYSGAPSGVTTNWKFYRNTTTGSIKFDVWNSTSFVNVITPLNNEFKTYIYTANHGGQATMIAFMYPINITYNNTLNVTIHSPANNYNNFYTNDLIFNFSATSYNNNLKNSTLYINSIFNDTLIFGDIGIFGDSGTAYYNKTFALGTYNWTLMVCDEANNCLNNTRNFNSVSFIENSQTYNNITGSASNEYFNINFSIDGATSLNSAYLVYNNTRYEGIITFDGTNYIVYKNITVPSTTVVLNKTFYWELNLSNGLFNSTNHSQLITAFAIDNCVALTNTLLNLTLRDEADQFLINSSVTNSTNNGTIEVDLTVYASDYRSIVGSYYNKFVINPARVCVNATLINNTYYLDAQIKYSASGYAPEYYYIQKYALTNTTLAQNITLYELNSSFNTDFLITYKDRNYIPVRDALIMIKRKYVSEGVYKISEIPKTDIYGQATGHFDRNGVVYSISVVKNGGVLLNIDNVVVTCQDSLVGKCELNLRENMGGNNFNNYKHLNNLNFFIDFNETNRRINLYFYTNDSTNALVKMNVSKFDSYMNGTVCNTDILASSGVLTCDIPTTFGNASFVINVYKDGVFLTREIRSITPNPIDTFGYDGIILTMILVLTLALMFIPSYIGVIIGGVIGLIVSSLLMIYKGGDIISFVSPIIWIIVAGVIIIWKIQSKRNLGGLS